MGENTDVRNQLLKIMDKYIFCLHHACKMVDRLLVNRSNLRDHYATLGRKRIVENNLLVSEIQKFTDYYQKQINSLYINLKGDDEEIDKKRKEIEEIRKRLKRTHAKLVGNL